MQHLQTKRFPVEERPSIGDALGYSRGSRARVALSGWVLVAFGLAE